MDPTTEDEANTWTPDRLRKHQSLTLSTDVTLLKCMQSLSMRIATGTNNLLKDLDALKEDTTSACVEVEYCIQNLNLISTKQFMEKRVYDEEVVEKKEETCTHIQPAGSIDFVPKIKEAIREGLPSIKPQVTNFEDQPNGYNPSKTLNSRTTKNNYSSRLLPYILGTEEFIDSPTVGVAERYQTRPEFTQSLQQPSFQPNSAESSPSLKSDLLVPGPADDKVVSDSEVSSISDTGGGISVGNREIEETANKKSSFGNLQDELAARLGGPRIANVKSAISSESISVKTGLRLKEDEEACPYIAVSTQANAEAMTRDIFQPPKKKNLFDDSSSDSEGELFKPKAPHVATVPSSVFSPPMPKQITSSTSNSELIVDKTTDFVAKNKGSNLFGSSDSEDDLFKGITTKVDKPAATSTVKSDSNRPDDEDNIFSSKSKISNSKSESKIPEPIDVTKVNNKPLSLFEDEDVPDFTKCKPPANNSENIVQKPENEVFTSNSQVKQTKPTVSVIPKQKNLFADSDSDEDLFRTILAKNKEPVAELNKPSSTSPLPDCSSTHSSRFQSTPIQNGDRKEEQVRKYPASGGDSNNIPVKVEHTFKPKLKASLLFDDDSDDEDLFGGVTSDNRKPSSSNVDNVKILHGDNLFNPVNESVTQGKVHVASTSKEDDLLSGTSKPASFTNVSSTSVAQSSGKIVGAIKERSATNAMKSEVPEAVINENGLKKDATSIATLPAPVVSKQPETKSVAASENLFGKFPSALPQHQQGQNPTLGAFEDSDDEDLFGSSVKRPLPHLPVKMPSKPQEIEDAKHDNLFGDVTDRRQLPPPDIVKVSTASKGEVAEIEDDDLFGDDMERIQKQTPPLIPVEESSKEFINKGIQDEEDIFSRSYERGNTSTNGPLMDHKFTEKVGTSNKETKSNQSLETGVGPQPGEQTASRIASLKLSLAKQPGLVSSESTDEEKTSSNTSVRKPFGGVPLFGPRIPSPVKSNPPSPTKTDEKIVPQGTVGSTKEDSGQNDILDCLGKKRPKAPGRRPPTRVFRRSQILDDEIGAPVVEEEPRKIISTKEISNLAATAAVTQHSEVVGSPTDKLSIKSKPVDRSMFDESDSSDGELFKTKPTDTVPTTDVSLKKGGLKSNAKINSSLLGSESDDSIFSSQAAIPTPKKIATPSFLLADSDDDDDLFASKPKQRDHAKQERTTPVVDNKATLPASDPLLRFQE